MLEKDDLDSAVSICIQQASEIDINRNKDQIFFYILTRLNGNQFAGRKKRGDNLKWDDYLTYNIKDLEQDDLEIALIAGDEQVGSVSLPYRRILRQMRGGSSAQLHKLRLENEQGRHTATLALTIKLFKREEIIGGVEPIKITLKPGADLEDSYIQKYGLEKNFAARRNFFSCADDTSLEWEFFPSKFRSRLQDEKSKSKSKSNVLEE